MLDRDQVAAHPAGGGSPRPPAGRSVRPSVLPRSLPPRTARWARPGPSGSPPCPPQAAVRGGAGLRDRRPPQRPSRLGPRLGCDLAPPRGVRRPGREERPALPPLSRQVAARGGGGKELVTPLLEGVVVLP